MNKSQCPMCKQSIAINHSNFIYKLGTIILSKHYRKRNLEDTGDIY